MKIVKTNSNFLSTYQSSTISTNEDGTYKVQHVFVDKEGKKTIVKYPRVKIVFDTQLSFPERFPCVFPVKEFVVLSDDSIDSELFTVEIEE